jgi:hypothetical protein
MRGRAVRSSNRRRGAGRGEDVGAVEAGAVVVALEGVVGRICWRWWWWRWHCFLGGKDGVSGDACASAWPSYVVEVRAGMSAGEAEMGRRDCG